MQRNQKTARAMKDAIAAGATVDNIENWAMLLSKYSVSPAVDKDGYPLMPRFMHVTGAGIGVTPVALAGAVNTSASDGDEVSTSPENPRLKYERRNYITVSAFHWGQYKLLLSEIEFLSYVRRLLGFDILDRIDHVVYAGSAGGNHIPLLADLFPKVSFHCWDPARFSDGIAAYSAKHPERIKLCRTLFTEQSAREYASKRTLFISDVRQFSTSPDATEEMRTRFKDEDHRLQRMWVREMKPLATMLKFSPPYEAMSYEYYDGLIVTQAYAPISSTESRLFVVPEPGVDDLRERVYDTKQYEEEFSYVNRVPRMRDLDNTNPASPVNNHVVLIRGAAGATVARTFTIEVGRMRTSTPMSGYDQWRSTQILFEWVLTEVSLRNWHALKADERKKYPPLATHTRDTFSVFYRDLIRDESLDAMIDAMNKVIEAYEAIMKTTFRKRMLASILQSDKE